MLRVIDFETTGLPPDAAVCEVGWCDVTSDLACEGYQQHFTNPGRPMPPEARAVHHISDEDVATAPAPDVIFARLMKGPPRAFVAHNAAFEKAFFAGAAVPWICTYKTALRLWPAAPSHSNQVLRYWLNLSLSKFLAMPPHRAAPDAYVTAHVLLQAMAAGATFEQMVEWSAHPALLVKVGFGKHRGQQWSAVPSDYLDWLLRQQDMGEDVHHTARHHLKLRRAPAQQGAA